MQISAKIKDKLENLPDKPGCYMMRNQYGRIIYIGKARSLKKRVRSYFTPSTFRNAPAKLRGLIKSAADIDIIVLKSESEAIIHEAQLIKDYSPKYNVSFKDDKRLVLLTIDTAQPFPFFKIARIKKSRTEICFGPCASSREARAALDFVEKRFGLRQCVTRIPTGQDHKHCIDDIIRYCSAPCIAKISREDYNQRVQQACKFLNGEDMQGLNKLREMMHEAAQALDFEKAADYRDTLSMIMKTSRQRTLLKRTTAEKRDDAMAGIIELADLLQLESPPFIMEAYDVSCISSTHAVASMVTAIDGIASPSRYRRFKIKTETIKDDPGMMAETINRRFERLRVENTPPPDLVMVDGGITQLRAATAEIRKLNFKTAVIGLAKRYEEIYTDKNGKPSVIRLPEDSNALQALQRIRDEAHRFALAYHQKLRDKRIRESLLDDISGIGPVLKAKLLTRFGSTARIAKASLEELSEVPGISRKIAQNLKESIGSSHKTHN